MSVDGTWALTMNTMIGEQKASLELATDGATLTGVMTTPDGGQPIEEGRVNGDAITFKVPVTKPMALTLTFDLTLAADELKGKFKPGMFPASPVTGVRA